MALSRRQFVQTAGIGAGAALTSNVWGRGRENSVWSAFEAELQAVDKGVICIASNENPVFVRSVRARSRSMMTAVCSGECKPNKALVWTAPVPRFFP